MPTVQHFNIYKIKVNKNDKAEQEKALNMKLDFFMFQLQITNREFWIPTKKQTKSTKRNSLMFWTKCITDLCKLKPLLPAYTVELQLHFIH